MTTNKFDNTQFLAAINACNKGESTFDVTDLSKHDINNLLNIFCETDNLAIIKYAISKGADPLNSNFHCLTIATINEQISIVDYLVLNYDYVKNKGEASLEALHKFNAEILDLLVITPLDEENLKNRIKSRSSPNEEKTLNQKFDSYKTKKNLLHELSQLQELDQNDKSSGRKKI